ncbi:ABC transporter permease [Candidatus Peregrinibacteria bacterium]|nr:ABC transporter permease [Candidatus Peregrinibacteria bacterium]
MLFKLILTNWRNKPARPLLTIITFTIGLTILAVFLGLISGLENYFRHNILSSNNLNQIEVQAKGRKLSLNPTNFLNATEITPEQFEKIRNLPNVESVLPQNTIKGISSLQVGIFGKWLQTDTLIFGASYAEIKDSGVAPEKWTDTNNQTIPVIISTKILDLYNLSFAKTNNLPEITPQNILGTDIIILLNQSTFYPDSNQTPISLQAKVVGFSTNAKLIGVTLPLEIVEKLNRQYLDQNQTNYLDLTVNVKRLDQLNQTRQEIEAMGLETNTTANEIEKLNSYFLTVNLVLSALFGLILLMAGLMLASTLIAKIAEKQKEIAILKALGFTQNRIGRLFLIEALMLSAIAATISTIIGFILSRIGNFWFSTNFQNIINKPEQLILFSPTNILITILTALLTSLVFSYLPAQKAAKLDPLPLLSK